jgi:hypothetical protein
MTPTLDKSRIFDSSILRFPDSSIPVVSTVGVWGSGGLGCLTHTIVILFILDIAPRIHTFVRINSATCAGFRGGGFFVGWKVCSRESGRVGALFYLTLYHLEPLTRTDSPNRGSLDALPRAGGSPPAAPPPAAPPPAAPPPAAPPPAAPPPAAPPPAAPPPAAPNL